MLADYIFMYCRSDSDTQAVWMSGDRRALFFWVLQRHSIHGEPELRKVAGRWEAPRSVSVYWRYGVLACRCSDHVSQLYAQSCPLAFEHCRDPVSKTLARLESCCIDYASHRGSTVISLRRSFVRHVATVAAFTQGSTGEFVVSSTEDWATHRRIIGTQWQLNWHLRKVVVASTLDGDDRVL